MKHYQHQSPPGDNESSLGDKTEATKDTFSEKKEHIELAIILSLNSHGEMFMVVGGKAKIKSITTEGTIWTLLWPLRLHKKKLCHL